MGGRRDIPPDRVQEKTGQAPGSYIGDYREICRSAENLGNRIGRSAVRFIKAATGVNPHLHDAYKRHHEVTETIISGQYRSLKK